MAEYCTLKCPHCGTDIVISKCSNCGRHYVLTKSHIVGRIRGNEDPPLKELPAGTYMAECDFCHAKRNGDHALAVASGLRQSTCPSCHREVLSECGYIRPPEG
jgi:hypothetical protein